MILIKADARHIPLRDETVQCVVTSPPYWGLRDYGLATWEGGNAECDHKHGRDTRGGLTGKQASNPGSFGDEAEPFCKKCGARRIDRGIGLERTPEEYVANIVAVFKEVKRVLRKDGLCWINLGDCYATGAGKVGDCPGGGEQGARFKGYRGTHLVENSGKESYRLGGGGFTQANRMPIPGLKPKDLVGIPWMVAFALRADGWYLRSDIIWAKPNPMPESVRDRPTKSHEYVFLLSKSQRYYYDQEAVREAPLNTAGVSRIREDGSVEYRKPWKDNKKQDPKQCLGSWASKYGSTTSAGGRNLRSVWTIATQPFPGAHFATFPEALAERCIKAGTSERGACPKCGAGWRRVMIRDGYRPTGHGDKASPKNLLLDYSKTSAIKTRQYVQYKDGGWSPSCSCDAGDSVPCIVLDPFGGSGTVARVAVKLGRRAVHLDLGYHELARTTRCTQIQQAMTCM